MELKMNGSFKNGWFVSKWLIKLKAKLRFDTGQCLNECCFGCVC